ncbi:MAG: PAS domain S-box protein [Phycisphaeraceae bacterium]|nr:PAS domain S-box protein [Phycisphaeraceae bacterium]
MPCDPQEHHHRAMAMASARTAIAEVELRLGVCGGHSRLLRASVVAAIVFSVCLISVVLITRSKFAVDSDRIAERHRLEQDQFRAMVEFTIGDRMREFEQALRAAQSYFDGSNGVDRAEWLRVVTAVRRSVDPSGVNAMLVITRIPEDQREALIATLLPREESAHVTQAPCSDGPHQFPEAWVVTHCEPEPVAHFMLGRDLSQCADRVDAMLEACDSNECRITGLIDLWGGVSTRGFNLYLPIFNTTVPPETIGDRRQALAGWVCLRFESERFLSDNAIKALDSVGQVWVHNGPEPSEDSLICHGDGAGAGPPADASVNWFSVPVAGRTWTVGTRLHAGQPSAVNQWLLPIGGVIFAALASGIAAMLIRTRARAVEIARRMTSELRRAVMESDRLNHELRLQSIALDTATILSETDADGRITAVNDLFCRVTGYSREELIGATHRLISSGRHSAEFWSSMFECLHRDGIWNGTICNRSKNGSLIWLKTAIVAIRDQHGRIVRFVSVRSDLTEQILAEESLAAALERACSSESELRMLLSIATGASRSLCKSEALHLALEALREATGCRSARVSRIGGDGTTGHPSLEVRSVDGSSNSLWTDAAWKLVDDSMGHGETSLDLRADPSETMWFRSESDGGADTDDGATGGPRPITAVRIPIRTGEVLQVVVELLWDGDFVPGERLTRMLEVAAGEIRRGLERIDAEQRVIESERFSRATVDALQAHVAILDERGTILAVNEAWRSFASANGSTGAFEGVNYLTVCRSAAGDSASKAIEAAEGVRMVLEGSRQSFSMEYDCHSPREQRWFMMRVARFPGDGAVRVVVSHENITEVRLAQERLAEQANALACAVEAARASEEQARAMIGGALDAAIAADENGVIISWNQHAEAAFGWTRDEAVGRNLTDTLIPERFHEGHRAGLARFCAQGGGRVIGRRVELVARCKDGREIPVEMSVAASRMANGRLMFCSFLRDISDRRAAEAARELHTQQLLDATQKLEQQAKELRATSERAEAASRSKSEFLAMVSHEIRTPLNGVIGTLDLLDQSATSEQQRRYIHLGRYSAVSLLSIINDILDFSKVEAGRLELHEIPFDLHAMVHDAVGMAAIRQKERGLDCSCAIGSEVPRFVHADPDRLRQVLLNLLSNAVKFTPRGSVSLQVEHIGPTTDGARAVVRFSVTDTGIGISPEGQKRLFQAFSQADATASRRFGGTGLGLAICKRLVELMGGSIGVDSEEGRGSTFHFEVPLTTTDPCLPMTKTVTAIGALERSALVIGAQGHIQHDHLVRTVRDLGYRIEEQAEVSEAIRWLQGVTASERRPEVMVLVDRPGASQGQAMADARRLDAMFARIPWILIRSDRGGDVPPLPACAAVLSTPFRRSALRRAVTTAVDSRHAVARTASRSLHLLLVEDNEINQVVARELLEQIGHRCAVAPNGRAALEAIERESFDAVLMDCQMPEMDGFEATREIRRREAERSGGAAPVRRIPIIALTANAVRGDRDRCLDAGMDDFITKPMDLQQVTAALDACVANSRNFQEECTMTIDPTPNSTGPAGSASAPRDEVPRHHTGTGQCPLGHGRSPDAQARGTGDEGSGIDPLDAATLVHRCMGDLTLVDDLLERFERQARESLTAIERLVSSGEVRAAAERCHALKGAAATMAADGVSSAAERIEKAVLSGALHEATRSLHELHEEVERCLGFLPVLRPRLAMHVPRGETRGSEKS